VFGCCLRCASNQDGEFLDRIFFEKLANHSANIAVADNSKMHGFSSRMLITVPVQLSDEAAQFEALGHVYHGGL
jgi:hypothetical protein